MAKCLILTDGKAGHENQSRAFARALGLEPTVFEIHFKSKLHKALSYIAARCGLRISGLFDRMPESNGCAVVVGTGSGTFYAASVFARRFGAKSGVVLYPRGYPLSLFDCILAPSFDRPAPCANVIGIPANLVANDAAFYAAGVGKFREHHLKTVGRAPREDNAVGVIVGGPNKCSTMTAAWIRGELDRVFAENAGAALWVTTSRRTPPDVEDVVASYPWDYALLYSKDRFNPIPAFVQLAKRLYVTAESTGMLSEACTFGAAEVRTLDNLKPGPHKFRRFVENLRAAGYVDGARKVNLSDAFARARELLLASR